MLERLLITGAAGGLGKVARSRLGSIAKRLRLSDIAPMAPAEAHEEVIPCDLADARAVEALVKGCDGILHLGGRSLEASPARLIPANVIGTTNVYEAARKHGKPRIFLASSSHVTGYYEQGEPVDHRSPIRPDCFYAVTKCFAEAVAHLYHDKEGIETAIVRIGSSFPEPTSHRLLATWLSYDDFIALVECVFRIPVLGCPTLYGVSDNPEHWWDNAHVDWLGWRPKDSSAKFRAKVDATVPRPAPDHPNARYQGGNFCAEPIHED